MSDEARSRRFTAREQTPLRREMLVEPWPELGLVASAGPADPDPELVVDDGAVVRFDGHDAAELESWAERLEVLGAPRNAAFVREAAEAYRARGLVGGV